MHQQRKITFISDRHKGIPNTLTDSWPYPYSHRYYLSHIRANFQMEFKDETLHILSWDTGCAIDPKVYKAKRA